MFYSIPNDKYDMGIDIYCVSIEDETISHIITEKYGIFYDQFFVYDHYLCYVSRIHAYKEIDLKGNLTVEFEDIHANCHLLCMDSMDYIMGDSVFLACEEKGVFVHTIGTKNMNYLGENPVEKLLCIYEDVAFYISEDGAEGTFAVLKREQKLNKIQKRGLQKATEECLLSATALNLKRLIKAVRITGFTSLFIQSQKKRYISRPERMSLLTGPKFHPPQTPAHEITNI